MQRSNSVRALILLAPLALASAASAQLRITEVNPAGSGNSPYAADWFEITNFGATDVDITGYRFDDNSNAFGSAVALTGVTSIPAGRSAIFLETAAPATLTSFLNTWFGSVANASGGYILGSYSGSGVGLSTSGDAVNIFTSAGVLVTRVDFGAATTLPNVRTFENAGGLNNVTLSTLSTVGVNGAFTAAGSTEVGSPFAVPSPAATALFALAGLAGSRRRR
ncbi:hypothetical protein BH11PLA1_BH11PLA1_20760 [soil metagenome]